MRQVEHERLGGVVGAVEPLGHQRHDGGDIDDRSLATRRKCLGGSDRQPVHGDDVQLDHGFEIVQVVGKQRPLRADPGIVDEELDCRVFAKPLLDHPYVIP
ncbi:hypothetical protein D3C87_1814000 [compost metagenome]